MARVREITGIHLRRASNGSTVHLGQVLGRGGEGTVYAVNGAPKHVAKVYLKPPDATKIDKLKFMTRGQSEALLGVAAWPTDLLIDEQGSVRGFLMGKISARQDAHRLYSPKSRRRTFPDADFRFVVRAATNLARAFAQIHAAGHVIGDVNHGNALVGKDGTAVLIDCDSIQVTEHARTFPCDVGSPLFTPPELQGKRFRGLHRTSNHDNFGLAALLFHLLFQGRHPFAGRFAEGEMPIERAIAESRFAYGASAAERGMSAPPATLALGAFGSEIADLFERAFAPPGEVVRPTAVEWIEPLQRLEHRLAACRTRPRHFHPGDAACCWCAIEKLSGARLFDEEQAATPETDAMTARQLWSTIESVSAPPVYAEPPRFAQAQQALDHAKDALLRAIISMGSVVAPVGILYALTLLPKVGFGTALAMTGGIFIARVAMKDKFLRARKLARAEWERALGQWKRNSAGRPFFQARAQLAALRTSLTTLAEKRLQELDRVQRRFEPIQRDAYLDSIEIDKAWFAEITKTQVESLANRGIRSAGDVVRHMDKLHRILRSAALGELRAWVHQHAASFKFDTSDRAYRVDADPIEERYRKERHVILDELRRGPELLAVKREEIADARAQAESQLKIAHEKLRRTRGLETQ
jgi:DNA-binding helix-hairpin-helix protein with protein kinase domain